MRLCLSAQNFFAYNQSNHYNIRQKILFLVKWGFPYSDIRNIPLDELSDYIKMINEYYEEKRRVESGGEPSSPSEPRPIGIVNKAAF